MRVHCLEGASAVPTEEEDFDLLSNNIADLNPQLQEDLKGCSIYLVGMMGSGKSTVGRMLANTLKYAFFDTDKVVEMAHKGMTVADVFKEYGEEYFRRCESQVLKELSPYKNLVIATGGGAVKDPVNWSYLHSGVVVWLKGDPELLAQRVMKDGVEARPLLYSEVADGEDPTEVIQAKLSTLLSEREKFYSNADLVVTLEGHGIDAWKGAPSAVVMYRLMKLLSQKLSETKQERELRKISWNQQQSEQN